MTGKGRKGHTHPNSLKNLKKWKKGQSGNPGGRVKMPPELKMKKKLTSVKFQKILNEFMHMTKEELIEKVKDKETTALEHLVLSIMNIGTKKGDERKLEFLLDRMIGKVKDQVEVIDKNDTPYEIPESMRLRKKR